MDYKAKYFELLDYTNTLYAAIYDWPETYGTVQQVEDMLTWIDLYYLILNDIDSHELQPYKWYTYLQDFPRFQGSKTATMILMEEGCEDCYEELIKLRMEYSVWREEKLQAEKQKK